MEYKTLVGVAARIQELMEEAEDKYKRLNVEQAKLEELLAPEKGFTSEEVEEWDRKEEEWKKAFGTAP